jgi:hypothetical protein
MIVSQRNVQFQYELQEYQEDCINSRPLKSIFEFIFYRKQPLKRVKKSLQK